VVAGTTTSDTTVNNPDLPVVTATFDSLIASNANVTNILTTCRSTYDSFNSFFLASDSNARQVAREVTISANGQSVDAVQVEWIFVNRAVVTTQDVAIESNSGGGIFLLRDGECGVDVFQGYGLNQDKTSTLQQFRNPSPEILACFDQIPANATVREYALYDIGGVSYGKYRHDYTEGNTTFAQVYEQQYNGSSYFVACPTPEVLATNVQPPVTFSSIQSSWLTNRCSGCHDRFGSAGLDLTAENAYANLVGVGSTRKEGAILVIANDPDNSYLLQKLEGGPDIVGGRMPNSRGMSEEQIQMVRDWISQGALDN